MPTVIQWVRHLEAKIDEQQRYAKPFEERYRNEFVLPFLLQEYREVYGARADAVFPSLEPPLTGTAAIGIDAIVERLTVTGAMSSNAADADAVRVVQEAWEDSDLDVMHREAHREAFVKARSFVQVLRSTDGRAVVAIESPDQMAVHREQLPPYDVDAALKIWVDEWTTKRHAQLWLPGAPGQASRRIRLTWQDQAQPDPEGSDAVSNWKVDDGGEISTGLLGVPVVEMTQRPRILASPVSEIEGITTLVDLADLVEGLMVFAGHFGAVPIRYATGLPMPRDPKDPTGQTVLLGPDGKPMVGFKPRADHFWMSTDKDTRFGQLEPAGLASFVTWAEHVSKRIRAKTAVPTSYYGVGVQTHMSAELLKTDEAPMVRRVLAMGRDGSFGQGWRRVQQLILMVERPGLKARVRPRWSDPETRVEAQATDSFQKVTAAGLGVRTAAEKILGWDPELVDRAIREHEEQQDRIAMLAEGLAAQTGAGGGTAPLVAV